MPRLIRLELLTPASDLMSPDTYNKVFSMHGIIMIFLFLVPSVPATLGNFLIPHHDGRQGSCLPEDQPAELVSVYGWRHLYAGGDDPGWSGYGLDLHHAAFDALPEHARGHGGDGHLHRGLLFDLYRSELYRDHPPHALPGHDVVPAAAVRLGTLCGLHPDGSRHAGAGHHAGAGCAGTHHRHRRLRSDQGRRSAAVSAFVLVLLAPCGLHHDSAGHGRDL